MPRPLADLLARVAVGCPPPPDGGVTVLPGYGRDAGVLAFTAHSVVFADVDPHWVRAECGDDLAAPVSASFLVALAERTGRRVGVLDLLSVAPPLPGPPPARLTEIPDPDHPRVRRAHRYRDAVTAWRGDGVVVVIGRGVAGRSEVAVEVDPDQRGRGVGRAALVAARHLVSEPLWAQVAPGNAASVRAFLAAGFVPVGAEVLLPRAGPC